jgi:hypothetical protein
VIEKRYQVFISSTYADLQEERALLMQVLPSMGCLPVGMDAHPAGGMTLSTIKKMIDDCDYYVALLGSRYGTLSPSGVSYTHVEYVYASTKQKPILVLMHDAPERRALELQERTMEGKLKFNDFRQLLMKGNCTRWGDAKDLEYAIRRALPTLIDAKPASGWVKATTLANPDTEKEVLALRERVMQLEQEREHMLSRQMQLVTPMAQGADLMEVSYRCKAYALGNCEDVAVKSHISWNDIFVSFAPYLSQMQSEDLMLAKISERVQETALADVQKLRPKAHAITDVQLAPFTFNTIKVQFRTLGLIRRQPKPGDNRQWWQLTSQGEHQMTSLLVVKKGRVAQTS